MRGARLRLDAFLLLAAVIMIPFGVGVELHSMEGEFGYLSEFWGWIIGFFNIKNILQEPRHRPRM